MVARQRAPATANFRKGQLGNRPPNSHYVSGIRAALSLVEASDSESPPPPRSRHDLRHSQHCRYYEARHRAEACSRYHRVHVAGDAMNALHGWSVQVDGIIVASYFETAENATRWADKHVGRAYVLLAPVE
jgi:hypothetical protein